MGASASGVPESDWVRDIAFAVRDLIRQHGIGRFREMVQRWAADRDKIPVDDTAHNLPLMRSVDYFADSEPVPKTLPEKYACLAAIHDGICLEAEPVNPWKDSPELSNETWEAMKPTWGHRVGFISMVLDVKKGRLSWEGCPWEDDLRRELLAVLEDIRADLDKSNGSGLSIGPVSADAADAKHMLKGENRIFIGHGRSPLWEELRDFVVDQLGLKHDEFNRVPTAGLTTQERLQAMLECCSFALLVMTAEDKHADGTIHARDNVIEESGRCAERYGPKRAIVLLEDGCQEPSNITGLIQIRFPKGQISAKFVEIRNVLKRERIL